MRVENAVFYFDPREMSPPVACHLQLKFILDQENMLFCGEEISTLKEQNEYFSDDG